MSQIKIVGEGVGPYDLELDVDNGDHLAMDSSLRTAILISLLTDRRCDPSEAPDKTYLGGHYSDSYPTVPGDFVGSRLWTLAGRALTPEVVAQAETYVREALQWMIEDGIVESQEQIGVRLEAVDRRLDGVVTIAKSDGTLSKWEVAWTYTLG